MLQLILGRAGTGKTRRVLDMASSYPLGQAVVVVPEQFTMETEKRLLEAMQTEALPASAVTSFSSMATQYHATYGKSGTYITELGRYVLMNRSLTAQNHALTVYAGRVTRSLTEAFLSVASELKTSRLLPETLMEQGEKQKGTPLGDKLHDISLVLSDYQARLDGGYLDSLDDLTKLAGGIREHGLYRGKTVFIDGFHNFSAQEEDVIAALLTQADKVVVALPCSGVTDMGEEPDGPIFENVREEARRLIGIAGRLQISVEPPIRLKENKRAKKTSLRVLETDIIRWDKEEKDCEGVGLYTACNVADEVLLLASRIGRDVRESGCRYRDCAVIARSLNDYKVLLPDTFRRAGIPFYMDTRIDITVFPLITLLLTALQSAAGDRWDEAFFRCLKTGFFPVTMDDIYSMENYVLKWDIGKSGMTAPFTLHPRGYTEEWIEHDKELLSFYEVTRRAVMTPLTALFDGLRGKFTGKEFCRVLYRFLTALRVPQQVEEACAALTEAGDPVKAGEQFRLWRTVVNLLDQLAITAGEEVLDVRKATELFRLACESLDMGRIPPTADAVTVGSADRIRVADVKRVYIIGCNEGTFPAAPSGVGLLSDSDREQLKAQGLRLGGDSSYWSVEEMFIAYKAFATPSESLSVFYRRLSFTGEKLRPSALVHMLKKRFPLLKETPMEALSPLELAVDPGTGINVLASCEGEETAAVRVLQKALEEHETYGPLLKGIREHTRASTSHIQSKETAAALFNRDKMRISATKLENFHHCPYQYFLQYGLRLETREKATLKPNTIGTMIHFVLEQTIKELSEKDLNSITPEEKTACVDKWCRYYYETSMGGDTGKRASFVYRYQRLNRLSQAITDSLLEEMKQSEYRPIAFELKVGKDGTIPSYEVVCDDGNVLFEGTVDRVDMMEGEQNYLRVVDYKTNSKKFAMNDLLYGLNMQMLIYLSALRKQDERFAKCLPGGVLYFPAAQAGTTKDSGSEEDAKDDGMRMNGVLLDDLSSLRGMERELEGRYIPAKMGKKGLTGGIRVSEEQMQDVEEYIDLTLRRMHRSLCQGNIGAYPANNPCRYCSYRAVCDHNGECDPYVDIKKRDTKEALAEIKDAVLREKEGQSHA